MNVDIKESSKEVNGTSTRHQQVVNETSTARQRVVNRSSTNRQQKVFLVESERRCFGGHKRFVRSVLAGQQTASRSFIWVSVRFDGSLNSAGAVVPF